MFLFCFIFRADTNLFLFDLIFKNLILHIFRIIILNIRCSGMFRNVWDVQECAMFLVLSTPYLE